MILKCFGNILKDAPTVDALVNPVNCEGVMGKGLALAISKRYPEILEPYKKACEEGRINPGMLFCTIVNDNRLRYIINFPTKIYWSNPSKYVYIKAGLKELRSLSNSFEFTRVAIPALGCGLGGLEWEKVEDILEDHLASEPIEYLVYPPQESHHGQEP